MFFFKSYRRIKNVLSFGSRKYSEISKQVKKLENKKDFNFDKLGFIGTGKIAQAIIIGLIKQNKILPHQIFVSDTNLDGLDHLRQRNPLFKVRFTNKNLFFTNLYVIIFRNMKLIF